jgi:hypothetical protein
MDLRGLKMWRLIHSHTAGYSLSDHRRDKHFLSYLNGLIPLHSEIDLMVT